MGSSATRPKVQPSAAFAMAAGEAEMSAIAPKCASTTAIRVGLLML
ncbi:MAG TPA: hypothetical protein VHW71_18500 [Steroidobacteraceae bacterium]|nr:hypothetical protein [Steroidobacteraceae bacterium]